MPRVDVNASGARAGRWPCNAWYVAAWASEVRDGLFARRLLGKPVLLYRTADGKPVALEDRCAHRFAPLSKGQKTSRGVQCPYHGLEFDDRGVCIHNPAGNGHIPANTAVRAYPVIERDRLLWIWMGEPTLADPASIPDMSLIPPAGRGHDNIDNYLHVKANYLLELDNLMDLSHVNFIHLGSLGHASMRTGEVRVKEQDGRIRADLFMPNTICGFGDIVGQLCDQWINIDWQAPTAMILEFGAVRPGEAPIQRQDNYAFHLITPETERTTHYFYGTSACFPDTEAWKAAKIREAQTRAFCDEDNPMLEAVQERMGDDDFWSLRPAILPNDAAAIRVRRRIEQMCRREDALAQPRKEGGHEVRTP